MKLIRLLMVVAFFGISASLVLADGVDPLVGIKSGGGSTPITITNPNPSFTATVGTTGCSIPGDNCALAVFQNQLGTTLTNLTIFIPTTMVGLNTLVFGCNGQETAIFTNCLATAVSDGTDLFFSGGSVLSQGTVFCVPDDDADDETCTPQTGDPDDLQTATGEFAVDIEGSTTEIPSGTLIPTQAVTTPEPGSALMLLFGMVAFGLLKVVRRAA